MTDEPATLSWPLSPAQARRVDQRCDDFAVAWQAGQPRIEDFLADVPEPERAVLLRELVLLDIEFRRSAQVADYRERFPDLDASWLTRVLARRRRYSPPASRTRRAGCSGAASKRASRQDCEPSAVRRAV